MNIEQIVFAAIKARSHLQCPPLSWLSGAEGCARAGR